MATYCVRTKAEVTRLYEIDVPDEFTEDDVGEYFNHSSGGAYDEWVDREKIVNIRCMSESERMEKIGAARLPGL
jgi:hypothetical protein